MVGGGLGWRAAALLSRLLLAAAVLAGSGRRGAEAASGPVPAPAQSETVASAPSSIDAWAAALHAPATAAALPPDAYLNAAGLPLLMPTNRSTSGRRWYYEIPRDPVGTVVMLHRCGRNAEDSWPPSRVCPQCIGMPEAVSISNQALARGYALLAINSANREVGSGSRCWSWGTDATDVRDIVKAFLKEKGLGGLPLYFTGCSSGGSLALRLPRIMRIDGIMPVAIGLTQDAFPLADPSSLKYGYPPVAFVHFAKDSNTVAKIDGMLKVMKDQGVPAAQARVGERAILPNFFAQRDDMISLDLSQQLHAGLEGVGVLNASDFLSTDRVQAFANSGSPPPWDALLQDHLGDMLEAAQAQQLELKKGSMLARAQQALEAAGEELLSIQEVGSDRVSAASVDASAAAEDQNPNFSDSDGVSSSSGGKDPYLSDQLLDQHIKEEIAVAYAEHTNLGDYTTAALIWLEQCGRANFQRLAEKARVRDAAALSPLRAVPVAKIRAAQGACKRALLRR
ncbi:hypothetical protein ABPG75_000932 [Micractinium tetrahymenae]